MTKDELKRKTNEQFGRLLRGARAASGKSLLEMANTLGMSELELKRVEAMPAEIPCRKLYRIIDAYGSGVLFEAELVFQEVDRLGRKFRATQSQDREPRLNVVAPVMQN